MNRLGLEPGGSSRGYKGHPRPPARPPRPRETEIIVAARLGEPPQGGLGAFVAANSFAGSASGSWAVGLIFRLFSKACG